MQFRAALAGLMIAAALAGGSARAAPSQPAAPLDPAHAEFQASVVELAYFYGVCERYVDKATTDDLLNIMTNASTPNPITGHRSIANAYAQSYAKGRKDADTVGWTEQECLDQIHDLTISVKEKKKALDDLDRQSTAGRP